MVDRAVIRLGSLTALEMARARNHWTREARRQLPALRAWRAEFHREPELSNQETRTREKVLRALAGLGIPAQSFVGNFNGIVGLIESERAGPVVALRADMDALPITEETHAPFSSRFEGTMHACGHDVHMACLLGAAAVLLRNRASLRGSVKLLFQPAEEEGGRGGALPLLERGAFENPRVDYVLGQHVAAEVPLGSVGWKKGALMAAPDTFEIRVRGTPGHASTPHQGPDAVLAAAEIVTGLQALVSRVRNPVDPVVVTVGTIHGGTRHNVIPREVVLTGTVRTVDPRTRLRAESWIRRRVRLLAGSMAATVQIRYTHGYPVLVNDPAATDRVVEALTAELGARRLVELKHPGMGGEDFARYLEKVPGTFLRLGVATPTMTASSHSGAFLPPESSLVVGTAALVTGALGLQGKVAA
ncbi:MAG: M20 family metallopeptidase [Thermoplasmata archaeon]